MKFGPMTLGAMALRTRGSLNSCSVPMIEKMKVRTSAGAISGMRMCQGDLHAAGAIDGGRLVELGGIDCSAAYRISML